MSEPKNKPLKTSEEKKKRKTSRYGALCAGII